MTVKFKGSWNLTIDIVEGGRCWDYLCALCFNTHREEEQRGERDRRDKFNQFDMWGMFIHYWLAVLIFFFLIHFAKFVQIEMVPICQYMGAEC